MNSASDGASILSKSDDDRTSVALKGATKAFRAPPRVAPKPDLAAVQSGRDNGALIAATRSWKTPDARSSQPKSSQPLLRLAPEAIRSSPSITPEPASARDVHLRSSSVPRQPSGSQINSQDQNSSDNTSRVLGLRKPPAVPVTRRADVQHQRNDSAQTTGEGTAQIKPPLLQRSETKELIATKQKSVPPPHKSAYRDQSLNQFKQPMEPAARNVVNAVVGAHVAVSRSPPKYASQLSSSPPRHRAALQNVHLPGSRSGSPRKGPAPMRQTMRSSESSSSEATSHHYHRPKRHPHKHHEGERKKWRDRLTDEELKRYAGWWAANRGHHVPKTVPFSQSESTIQADIKASYKPDEEIVNVVVRDLWQRSRLSNHVLHEIWQLVDDRKIGSLTKDQFIVGVWLIDQKLKGHKLPTHISQSVWQSVARLNGLAVKIRVP